jgi:adenylate cyclase
MNKRLRHIAICALIAVSSAVGARLLSNFRFFQLLNLKALDLHFLLRGRQPTSNIILVTGDQKALDTFPELRIFWHPYYTEAIHAAGAAGAKVIGLDLAFGVPVTKYEPDYDRMLSEAVSSAPIPVVCGYVSSFNTNQEPLPVPINMVAAVLGLSGYANLTLDPDDFVRSQELLEAPSANTSDTPLARSFALRVVEKYLGSDADLRDGRLTLAGQNIPISADRSISINYAGPPDTFPRVSLADVVAASRAGNQDQLRNWFQDKIVLVGSDSADDRDPTPFYAFVSGPHWLTAGVEIHANTIRTILDRRFLLRVPEWVRIAGLLIAAALTAGIVTSVSAGPAAGWLMLQALAMLVSTHLLFSRGWILSTSEMFAAAAFALVVTEGYRFTTAERKGNLFHRAISLFVGKELAAHLESVEAIQFSGKRQVVTIMFTDIRGFTAFSEQVCDAFGPEAVVEMLNEYMALMVPFIVKYHGHVNKFIGDGILAVFSDEDEGAKKGDHATRAVRCGTEMVSLHHRFKTGAGIHTGLAVLGNVGSADKMEYTVLGDTVNLASRLESLNKEHHTRLLMSGTTRSLLPDDLETTHLGAIPVRGKAVPINLYTVTALVAEHEAVNV